MQNSNSSRNRTSRLERIENRYRSSLSAIDWAIRRAERNSNFKRAGGLQARRNSLLRSREAAIAALAEERLDTGTSGGLSVNSGLDNEGPFGAHSGHDTTSLTDRVSTINLSADDLSSVNQSDQALSLRRFLFDRDLLQVSQILSHWTRDQSDLLDYTVELNFAQTGTARDDLRVHLRSIASLISEIRATLLDESPSQYEQR